MSEGQLFTPWPDEHRPVDAVLDAWSSFERSMYLAELARLGLEGLTDAEWQRMTAPGSGWAATREAAEEQTGRLAGRHVVVITRATVRSALCKWLEVEQ